MDIIGCTSTRKLCEKITPNKCTTERLMKRDEHNSQNEGEIIIIRKT